MGKRFEDFRKEAAKQMHITPVGVAKFPYLNRPDTKFSEGGDYKVSLILTGDEAKSLKKLIDTAIDKTVTEASIDAGSEKTTGAKPYAALVDKETGKATGEVRFNFKQKAVIQTKKGPWEKKPVVVDTKNQLLPSTLSIGSGSRMRVAFNIVPYTTPLGTSVSLRLCQVQIHELVLYTGGGEEETAFDEAEEGFTAESFEFGSGATVEDDTDVAVAKSVSGDF